MEQFGSILACNIADGIHECLKAIGAGKCKAGGFLTCCHPWSEVDLHLIGVHDASEVFQGQFGVLSCSQAELGTMERHPAGEMLSPDIERRTVGWPAASWLGSFAAAAEYWPRRSLGDTRGFVQGRSDLSGAHGQKIGPFAAGVLAHFLGEFFSGFIDSG